MTRTKCKIIPLLWFCLLLLPVITVGAGGCMPLYDYGYDPREWQWERWNNMKEREKHRQERLQQQWQGRQQQQVTQPTRPESSSKGRKLRQPNNR